MRNQDLGILHHIDCVRFCLKHNLGGDYYGFVNLCCMLRNSAKHEREKNRYRLWRLVCLLCFDEDNNFNGVDVVQWKRIIRAYHRYIHS